MNTFDTRMSKIYEYLLDVVNVSHDELKSVKSAICMVHEIAPTDTSNSFSKINSFISASDDVAWIVSLIKRKIISINTEIKKIKDPNYTMLVRQGRPSHNAIEHEIRFNNDELVTYEEQLEILKNVCEYFEHLQGSIDKYLWLLRDRMKI